MPPPFFAIFEDRVVMYSPNIDDHYLTDSQNITQFSSKWQLAPFYKKQERYFKYINFIFCAHQSLHYWVKWKDIQLIFVINFKLIIFVWGGGGHCDCSPGASINLATPLHACCFMATAKHQTLSCASAHIFPFEGCEGQFAARCNKKYGTENAQIWHRDRKETTRRST